MEVDGKTVIVTGGSAGIGLEIARQLSARGAQVVIVGRDAARAEAARAVVPGAEVFLADLALPTEQERLVEAAATRWPRLAVLVNNAGVQVNLPDIGVGASGLGAALRQEIDINLTAPVLLALGLMPLLARQPEAAILNITSGLAVVPKRCAPVYCATKAGLRTFSQALRYRCEDAAPSIRVIDAVMAYVDTGMTRGRGGDKLPATEAARAVVRGLLRGRPEIWVGRTRVLRIIHRLWPSLAARLLRNA